MDPNEVKGIKEERITSDGEEEESGTSADLENTSKSREKNALFMLL